MRLRPFALAAALAIASTAHAGTVFDFTGGTASGKTLTFNNGGVNLTLAGGGVRMGTAPTNFTSVVQTWGNGIGVGSVSDWDTLGFSSGAINWSFTGPGETLYLTFDQAVRLDKLEVFFGTGALFATTTAFAYALENGVRTNSVSLNSWFSGTPSGVATKTVDTSSLVGTTFAISGIVGIDHLDTYVILRGVEVSPIPEPSTYGLLAAGLGVVGFMARRRREQQQG